MLADKIQIQQVLLNLMRNAVEAMQDSAKRELLLAAARLTTIWSGITVADTGSGICAGGGVPALSALYYDQAARHGGWSVDLPNHRRIARRSDLGRTQSGRRNSVSLYAQRRAQGGGRRCQSSAVVHVIDDDDAARDSLAFFLRAAQIDVRTYETAPAFLGQHQDLRCLGASSPMCECQK